MTNEITKSTFNNRVDFNLKIFNELIDFKNKLNMMHIYVGVGSCDNGFPCEK